MWLLTLQLFKNSIDTQGKLRLSVSELLEYKRKGRFPLGGIFRAERNFSLSFLISSTQELTRQRKIPLLAENSAQWKMALSVYS
jgi:hypothetical protein